MMGTTTQGSPKVTARLWLTLAMATLALAVAATIAGAYFTLVIESPLIAPTRDNPATFVGTVLVLWLGSTGLAVGVGVLASRVAGLRGPARRRWWWFVAAVIVAVWTVVLVQYAVDPFTALRWGRH